MQGGQTPQTRRMDALLKRPENKVCFDCGARQPRWASSNFGIFLCLRCAGFHRALGVHICTIKSTNMDNWDNDMLDIMDRIGNEKAVMLYEARLPAHFRKPEPLSSNADIERAVRLKYGTRDFWNRDYDALYKELVSGSHGKPVPPASSMANTGVVQGRVVESKPQSDWGGFEESKVMRATVVQPIRAPEPVPVAVPQAQPKESGALDDFFAVNVRPTQQPKVQTITDDDIFGSVQPQRSAPTRNYENDIFGEMVQAPPVKTPAAKGGFDDDFFGSGLPPQPVVQQPAHPQQSTSQDPFRNALDAFTGVEHKVKQETAGSQPSMSELAYSSDIRNTKGRAW